MFKKTGHNWFYRLKCELSAAQCHENVQEHVFVIFESEVLLF